MKEIFSDGFPDEQTTEGFLDFLIELEISEAVHLDCIIFSCGNTVIANRFIENKQICLKVLELLSLSTDSMIKQRYSASQEHQQPQTQYTDDKSFKFDLVNVASKIMKAYLNDSEVCEFGHRILEKILPFFGSK